MKRYIVFSLVAALSSALLAGNSVTNVIYREVDTITFDKNGKLCHNIGTNMFYEISRTSKDGATKITDLVDGDGLVIMSKKTLANVIHKCRCEKCIDEDVVNVSDCEKHVCEGRASRRGWVAPQTIEEAYLKGETGIGGMKRSERIKLAMENRRKMARSKKTVNDECLK